MTTLVLEYKDLEGNCRSKVYAFDRLEAARAYVDGPSLEQESAVLVTDPNDLKDVPNKVKLSLGLSGSVQEQWNQLKRKASDSPKPRALQEARKRQPKPRSKDMAEETEQKPAGRPGVINKIKQLLLNTDKGMTVDEVVEELKKTFPDRSEKSMRTTVRVQLGTRLKKEGYNVIAEPTGEGRGKLYRLEEPQAE